MQPIEMIRTINYLLSLLFVICYAYQLVYVATPYLVRLKPHGPVQMHRYAVLISARNEEAVLDVYKRQDHHHRAHNFPGEPEVLPGKAQGKIALFPHQGK